MAESDVLERILRTGQEGLAAEFKKGLSWTDPSTKGKVIRTALAMGNLRDGGVLAFGLERKEPNPLHEMVGMTEGDFESFSQDEVTATVNAHATPHIDLTVQHLKIEQKLFVAVVVRQFADFPIICAKDFVVDGKAVVVRGRIYCRSRRTPESTEVQVPEDLRHIINLATDKGVERYFQLRQIEQRFQGPSARELFRQQLGDLAE